MCRTGLRDSVHHILTLRANFLNKSSSLNPNFWKCCKEQSKYIKTTYYWNGSTHCSYFHCGCVLMKRDIFRCWMTCLSHSFDCSLPEWVEGARPLQKNMRPDEPCLFLLESLCFSQIKMTKCGLEIFAKMVGYIPGIPGIPEAFG